MNTNKQIFSDIDVNAFIQKVADAGINEEKPATIQANSQKDSQAETVAEPAEEKPKETVRRKRGQDYENLFLLRNEIRTRQGLYIGRDNYETLQTLVRAIRSERLSVSGLVDNIIRHHIETYEDEIDRIYEENIRKPTKRKQ
jgi:hypothetical protein